MIHTTIRAVRFGNIILLTALLCGPFAAFAADEKLNEAQKLYQAGDWEKARQAYGEILAAAATENLPPSFFYNLGTASARAGANGVAYAYLLKALAGNPWDTDTIHNLQLAESKMNPAVHAVQPSSWISSWPMPLHFVGDRIWLLPILLSGAGLLWSAGSRESRARRLIWGGIFLAGVALGFTGYQQTRSPAAAFVKQGQVKSGPAASYSNIVVLEPGSLVNVEEERDGWMKIRFVGADQQEAVGWIEAGALLSLR